MDEYEMSTVPSFKRDGFTSPSYELHIDNQQVIVLSDHVVEYLRADRPADESNRFHVKHLAVEVKPARRGGYKLNMGLRRDGGVWNLAQAEFPEEKMDEVMAFFEIVKKQAAE